MYLHIVAQSDLREEEEGWGYSPVEEYEPQFWY